MKRSVISSTIAFAVLAGYFSSAYSGDVEETCYPVFRRGKAVPKEPDCVSKAAQSPVDLSTAICTGSPDVIDSYCKAKCEVDPLKPISDADAIAFENGATVQEDNLTDATKAALACLRAAASAAGGQLVVTSAYRPQAYQDHLYEVYSKDKLLTKLVLQEHVEECRPVPYYDSVHPEKMHHGLNFIVGKKSNHSSGTAFDAGWGDISNIDQLAQSCGLVRPWPTTDRVHFTLITPGLEMLKSIALLASASAMQVAAAYDAPSQYGIKLTVDARHEIGTDGVKRAKYSYTITNVNAPLVRTLELGSDSDAISSQQLLVDKEMLIATENIVTPQSWDGAVLRVEEGNAKKAVSWQVSSSTDRSLGIAKGQSQTFVVYTPKVFAPLVSTAMVVGFDSYKYTSNPVVEVKTSDVTAPTISTTASYAPAADRPGWLKVSVSHALADNIDPYPEVQLNKIESNQGISAKDYDAVIGSEASVIYLKQAKDRVYTLYYKAFDASGNAGTSKTKVDANK